MLFPYHVLIQCFVFSLDYSQQEEYVEMAKSLDDATRRRKQHTAGIRKCYIHSILDLQEEHRAEGIYDPKGLACMAKRCTKYSTRDAATRGKEMEKEATRMKRSETLDILKSVLSMMDEMDASCQRKQDTSLQPPMRLMSPKREYWATPTTTNHQYRAMRFDAKKYRPILKANSKTNYPLKALQPLPTVSIFGTWNLSNQKNLVTFVQPIYKSIAEDSSILTSGRGDRELHHRRVGASS